MDKVSEAEMVLINANVITMDKKRPRAEAIAIKDGKFMKVGGADEVKELIGKKTEIRDVKGMTVVPGFNDVHNHVTQFGLVEQQINLRNESVQSINDILNIVGRQAEHQSKGTWIMIEGYNQNVLEEKRHITCWELDKVAPDNIVCLRHVNMNMYVLNSKLLAMMGIDKNTEDLEDAEVVKDIVTGEPTGLLNPHPSCERLNNLMPKVSRKDILKSIEWVNQLYLSQGITSTTDEGVGMSDFPGEIGVYQEAIDSDIFNVRINLAIWSRAFLDFENLDEELKEIDAKLLTFGIRSGLGNEKLRIGPFKIVLDGPLSGGGTATHEPYGIDPQNQSTGVMAIQGQKLEDLVSAVHSLGWQLSVHAIGDRAIDEVLDVYEAVLKRKPKINHRFRIEHTYMPSSNAMDRAKQLGVSFVMQPGFIWELGDSFISHLGPEKAAKTFPFKSLLEKGVSVAFSSDRPVTSIISGSPLLGIHAAVNQRTVSGQEYALSQKILPEEALRLYTLDAAYTTCEENIKGSIEVDKLADLTILSEDLTNIEITKIKDIQVKATMVGGKFFYEQQ